jgi:hypothetical protein
MRLELKQFWEFYLKNCKDCMTEQQFYEWFPEFLNMVQWGHMNGAEHIPVLLKSKSYILNLNNIIKKVNG